MPKAKPFSATPNVDADTFDEVHPAVSTHRKQREKPEEKMEPPPPQVSAPIEEPQEERNREDELRKQLAIEQQRLLDAQRALQEAQQRAEAAERAALAAKQQAEAEKKRTDTTDKQRGLFPPKKAGTPPSEQEGEERRLTVRVSPQISKKLEALSDALGVDETGCLRLGLIELWERHAKAGLFLSLQDPLAR